MFRAVIALVLVITGLQVHSAACQTDSTSAVASPGAFGLRLGIGTDISGGIAYGGQIGYTLIQQQNAFELGLGVFGGKYSETSDNGSNTYEEETNLVVIAAMANYLFRHAMEIDGPYFVAGIGVGAFSASWEERSDTDTSLGTPLPGGGSMQSEDGTSAGLILNFGIGHRFTPAFDLRFQIPTFFIPGSDERDGATVPTFTLTAGILFGQ